MTNSKVAAITFNPAYDLVGTTLEITLGEVNRVHNIGLHAAGKGINVAKVLRNLDIDVTAGGFLGRNNQEGFLQLFDNLGIHNRFQLVNDCTRTNVKLTEQKTSKVTDLNFSGFTVNEKDQSEFFTTSLTWLDQFAIVTVSGSLPAGIDLAQFTDWMSCLSARLNQQQPPARLIFDSSGEAFAAGLRASSPPWLVKPNRDELATWAGRPLPSNDDVITAARQLLQYHGVSKVVVSLGAKGALWIDAKESWLAEPPKCEVVSTVGAGDAMVGGLIYALLQDSSPENTLRLATATAVLAVSQSSVGVADKKQLTEIMARVTLKSLR